MARKSAKVVKVSGDVEAEAEKIRLRFQGAIQDEAEQRAFEAYVAAFIEHELAWNAVREFDMDGPATPALIGALNKTARTQRRLMGALDAWMKHQTENVTVDMSVLKTIVEETVRSNIALLGGTSLGGYRAALRATESAIETMVKYGVKITDAPYEGAFLCAECG